MCTIVIADLCILKDLREAWMAYLFGLSVAKAFSVYYCISLLVHSERLARRIDGCSY